jgi:hypothetical protein
MPLATCTTPANGDEHTQVISLLDVVRLRTGQPNYQPSGKMGIGRHRWE